MSVVIKSRRTTTISLRLDEELLSKLRLESKNQEVSTNTLACQAFKRFLEWDICQPKMGDVSINKPVFIKIFENLTEAEVIKLACTIGKDDTRDVALFMKGKIDIESFMAWFVMQMVNSSVQISHTMDNNLHTYVMKHDLGKNWSLYHKTILEVIFEKTFNIKAELNCGARIISLRFAQ
ncbi:MAG: hypothetical protein ACREBB_02285 [Nitrosotalea sp.]